MPAVLSKAEAVRVEKQIAKQKEDAAAPIKGDGDAPPKGGDGSAGPAGNVGGYNSFWIDSGSQYTMIDGQKRTSILVDPPDGRVPPLTPEAQQRKAARGVGSTPDEVLRGNE